MRIATLVLASLILPTVTFAATAPPNAEADRLIELAAVTVTMTRLPTAPELVPASISTITGEELRARGVDDLRTALSLTAGVRIAPGGDDGPFGSVPGMRGLTEGDDYLLVVDGVPVGGVFNPATQTLDLHNIDKIEVLRGASPVLFGAISFVGVINVSHFAAGEAEGRVTAFGGSRNSGGLSGSTVLAKGGDGKLAASVSGEVEHAGLAGQSSGQRGHVLLRTASTLAGGSWHLDADVTEQRAKPASPTLFAADAANPLTPTDANYNFSDAYIKDSRQQLSGGYTRQTGLGQFGSTVALTNSRTRVLRGFIEAIDPADSEIELNGARQARRTTDFYLDTHLNSTLAAGLTLSTGADWLHGRATQGSQTIDYKIADGDPRPSSSQFADNSDQRLAITRDYLGFYSQARWAFGQGWSLLAGGRLNQTYEHRKVTDLADDNTDRVQRSSTRFSGLLGLNKRIWTDGDGRDAIYTYVSYRNTFKPADADFSPQSVATLLSPQNGESVEAGFKGRGLDGNRFTWYADVYANKVKNVVVDDPTAGTLTNAGEERFYGGEVDARLKLSHDLTLAGEYTYTNSRYRDYIVDGVQERGKRVKLAPLHEASIGLIFAPLTGVHGSLVMRGTGTRYLDTGNQAQVPTYGVVDAAVGYRYQRYDLELVGSNLGDRRDVVSGTDRGENQFYRLPASKVLLRINVAL